MNFKSSKTLVAGGAVLLLVGGIAMVGLARDEQTSAMMSDGLVIYHDGTLDETDVTESQFYQSSFDWRHFMLNYHAQEYRRFIDDTNDGLVLPNDVLGQSILRRFIDAYVEHVDNGLERITDAQARDLLREHASILAFALREHGASTCLAYAYSRYVSLEPDLRVSYLERKEQFRQQFHALVGPASQDLSPVIDVFDVDESDVPLELVSPGLTDDQVTYLEGGFADEPIPQAFVCLLEIDRLQALIESDEPRADALRRGVLRKLYDPRRGTMDLRRLAAS